MIARASSSVSSGGFRSLLFKSAIWIALALLSPPGMAAGLKGWWRFDGNLNDGSGSGLNGTAMGAPTFDAAIPPALTGQSILFDADAEGVQIAASPALNAVEFTLGYYINLRDVPPGTSGLERLTARQDYAFETAVGDAHALGVVGPVTLSYYSPSTGWVVTNVPVPANGWLHVTWRNSATQMTLYLNGVEAGTGPPVTNAITGFMNFGTAQNNDEGFDGLMDDVFLWDGLLTPAEIAVIAANGMAVFAGDSDGDGLPNSWENLYGLNPNDNGSVVPANGASGNPDTDGLTNLEEFNLGTDPTKADTDSDGLNDGNEVTRSTNPLVADTDGDGLLDGDEITRQTNPLAADTDTDGVNDGDEVAAASNPLDPASLPPPSYFLVMQLMFEGDTQDSSPLANHGALLNGPAFVAGDSPAGGQALSFSANNMGVTVGASASLASNFFTLCYWVKPTTLQEGAGLERLTSRAGDAFETAIGNRAALGGAPDLTLSYYQGTWVSSGKSLVLNEWAHVAWRNDATGMSLFVDGQLAFTGPGVPAGRPGSGHMNIGTRHNAVEGFEGFMDDVRLYRVALKDSAIATISTPVGLAPFEIFSIERAPGAASVTLRIRSRPGRVYAVDFCTDLTAPFTGSLPGWTELTDALPASASGAETVYMDSAASNLPRAFYRARDVTP